MKNSFFIISILVFLFSAEMLSQTDSASLIKKVEGFSHPESVVLDEENEVLYISNIGETEGDGYITKVSRNGEILDLKWITGLNDPKGLLLIDEKLYVSDNTDVVEINIQNSEITNRISVEDAVFLNDITADEQGNIYISDSGKSSIYKMDTSGEISEWLNTEELEFPNGLLAVDGEIWVAAWGKENGGNVLKVDIATKRIEKISKSPIGNLDGIQLIENQSFYFSDWATGNIYRVNSKGDQTRILTSEKSAGDILFLKKENVLVLPMNHQNEVWWYQLE